MKQPFYFFLALAATMTSCAPRAEFTVIRKQKLVAPAEVTFSNRSVRAESYEWDFGDGSTSQEESPKHTYMHSGNYTVKLTAKKGKETTTNKYMIQVTAPERCLVEIETNMGTMLAELYNATPKHRDNFIKLAEDGFYNDLLFHRVIAGFMIQGGDPTSRNAKPGQSLGFGDPGYTVPGEFVDSLVHIRGAICAARTPNPEKKSSGSQFYIVHGSPVTDAQLNELETAKRFHYTPEQRKAYLAEGGTPMLDRDYTVYGRVIKGFDVLDKIATTPTGPADRPVTDVKMKIRIIK